MNGSRRIWLGIVLSLCVGMLSACGGGGGSSSAPGSFTLSTTNVSFSGKYGGAAPATQTITLHLTDGGAATAGAGYANGEAQASWLTVTAAGSGSDYTFTLSVNTTSISAGTYSTVLTLGTADANNNILQTQAVQVSYSLSQGLTVSGGTGPMTLVIGDSAASAPQQFTVSDPSAPSVQWTAQSNASWLVGPSGTQSGTGTFSYSINTAGVGAGNYTGTLTLTNTADPTDSATLSVSVTLQAPEFLIPSSLVGLGDTYGRDLTPQPLTFILNTHLNGFAYTATATTTSGGNWLTLTPTSGTVSGNGATVTASANPQGLVSGTYQGHIQLQANVDGTLVTQSVLVVFALDQNRLLVDAEGAALSSFPSRQVLTRTLSVANTWGVSGVQWQTQSDMSWLTATASGTTGSPLVLTANPTGLTPGEYIGHITISSPDANIENQQTVRVGLTVGTTDPVAVLDVPGSAVTQVVASPVEPFVFVETSPTGPINVYDTNTGALVRTLSGVFTQLSTMVISGDGQTLYVMDGSDYFVGDPSLLSWTVHEFDVNSGTLLASVPIPQAAGAAGNIPYFAYARPGAHPELLIPTLGGGTTIELKNNQFNASFQTTYLDTIAVSPDQTKLYLVESGGSSPTSSIYSTMTYSEVSGVGLLTTPTTVLNSATGWDIAVSADGSHVFLAGGIDVLSGTDLSLQTTLAGNIGANSVATSWNGLLATGSNSDTNATTNSPDSYNIWIYDPSLNLLGTLQSDPGTGANAYSLIRSGLQVSGDGTRLVSATQGGFRIQTLPAPPQ